MSSGFVRPFSVRRNLYRASKRALYGVVSRRWRSSRAQSHRLVRNHLRGRSPAYLVRLIREHAFATAVAIAIVAGNSAHAASPIELSEISLDSDAGGFVINGITGSDRSGVSVSSAGDVNGDGIPDVIVGAYYADANGFNCGESYVVFGKSDGTAVELSDITAGVGGFVINGVGAGDNSGFSVAGAGDVNGDDFDDLVIGARGGDPGGVGDAGESYVVFGKADTDPVELSDVTSGTGGFVINGSTFIMQSGMQVAGAGDVNGDGLGDVIVSSSGYYSALQGASFVVFGKADGTAVELSDIGAGTGGFIISGFNDVDGRGMRVSGAGDVNGDTFDDVIVSSNIASPAGRDIAGQSYVVFGKSNTNAVSLSSVASGAGGGFAINGASEGDFSGTSVSGAGDVNGDGLADVIVGAPGGDLGGTELSNLGECYVVFGKTSTTAVDLIDVAEGTGGFSIRGKFVGDEMGHDVSGAGDVNGDGFDDVIVATPYAFPGGGTHIGQSFVVFGKSNGIAVELSAVLAGAGGFALNGSYNYDVASAVSSAGDINGDGLDDIIVGAPGANATGQAASAGESCIVFSPIAGPVQWVDFAFTGIPEGTQALPFKKLAHAVNAVADGGTVNIKGNTAIHTSSESLVIDKDCTILAINGTVTIGAP